LDHTVVAAEFLTDKVTRAARGLELLAGHDGVAGSGRLGQRQGAERDPPSPG